MAVVPLTSVDAWNSANVTVNNQYTMTLSGGRYEIVNKATAYSTGITLKRFLPDRVSLTAALVTLSADGEQVKELGPGLYEWDVPAAASGVQIAFNRIRQT